jgi:hypothetical protein
MSKPITTVAAMILAEENKLDVGALLIDSRLITPEGPSEL